MNTGFSTEIEALQSRVKHGMKLASTPIFEGETVGSGLRRAAELAGGLPWKLFTRVVSNVDADGYWEEAFGLDNVSQTMHCWPTPDDLARLHTRFDFQTAAASPEGREVFRRHLFGTAHGPAYPSRRYQHGQPKPQKYVELHCAACDELARVSTGDPYGRRVHLYPLMTVCPVHREPLRPWLVGVGSEQTLAAPYSAQNDDDLRWATILKECIESPYTQSPIRKEALIARLDAAGFFSRAGRCAVDELIRALVSFFKGRFHNPYLARVVEEERHLHAQVRALLCADKSVSPVTACLIYWLASEVSRQRPALPPPYYGAKQQQREQRRTGSTFANCGQACSHLQDPRTLAYRAKRLHLPTLATGEAGPYKPAQ